MEDTKRRIEITVEKRRLIVLRRARARVLDWCADCGEQVAMLTPDQAATIARVSSRTIYRRVEAGERLRVTVDRRPVAELGPLPARQAWVPRARIAAGLVQADAPLAAELAAALPDTIDRL